MKRQSIAILVIISITAALMVAGCSSKEDSGSGLGSTREYTTSMVDMLKFDSGEYDSGVFIEHYQEQTSFGLGEARGRIPISALPAKVIIHDGNLVVSIDSIKSDKNNPHRMIAKTSVVRDKKLTLTKMNIAVLDSNEHSFGSGGLSAIPQDDDIEVGIITDQEGIEPAYVTLFVTYRTDEKTSSYNGVEPASSPKDEGTRYWNTDKPVTEASHTNDVQPASIPKEKKLHALYPGLDKELTYTTVDENTIKAYEPNKPEMVFTVTSPNGVVVLDLPERQSYKSFLSSAREKWSFSINSGASDLCELTGFFKDLNKIPGVYVTTPKGEKKSAENFKIVQEGSPILSATNNGFNDIDICIMNTKSYKRYDAHSAFPWTENSLKLGRTELSNDEIWEVTISGEYL